MRPRLEPLEDRQLPSTLVPTQGPPVASQAILEKPQPTVNILFKSPVTQAATTQLQQQQTPVRVNTEPRQSKSQSATEEPPTEDEESPSNSEAADAFGLDASGDYMQIYEGEDFDEIAFYPQDHIICNFTTTVYYDILGYRYSAPHRPLESGSVAITVGSDEIEDNSHGELSGDVSPYSAGGNSVADNKLIWTFDGDRDCGLPIVISYQYRSMDTFLIRAYYPPDKI